MKSTVTALVLAALSALIAGASASAQMRPVDNAPHEAVSRYVVGTRLGYITCSNKYRDYVDKWEKFALVNEGQNTVSGSPPADADYRECVQETLIRGRSMYGSASKVAVSTPAKAALKDYQTAWEGSLATLGRQGGSEKANEYRSRQRKVLARLDELQRKVEAQAK